jgi:hypothetical protein
MYYGACFIVEDDRMVITRVFPVTADWEGYRHSGYCRPTLAEIKAAGFETGCVSVFAVAATQEAHPAVRRVMEMNAWKIDNWREYASWKKHAKQWVAMDWRQECHRMAALAGFEVVEEAQA